MSTLRIVPYVLIFLITLLCSTRMAWSRPEAQVRHGEALNRPPIRTAQLLQEVGEEEYRTGQFIRAARSGEIDKVRKFLAEGTDVNSKNRNEDTALMEACAAGQKAVVELLLAKGADLKAKNKSGHTAIDKAVMNKHYEVTVLISKTDKVDLKDILIAAVKYGYVDLAREIIGAINETFHGSWLVLACQSGETDLVRLILEKGADPNYENGEPLLVASSFAPLEAIKLLLDKGAKVDLRAPGSTGHTALSIACYRSRVDVAKLLLENGANINVKVKKEEVTPLMLAIEKAKTKVGYELVELLISRKADVNLKNSVGDTALHQACFLSLPEVVRLLLDNGADIEAKAELGVTPLMVAAATGQASMVQLLLERGANPNVKAEKGFTAMVVARKAGHKDVQAILTKHGAKE